MKYSEHFFRALTTHYQNNFTTHTPNYTKPSFDKHGKTTDTSPVASYSSHPPWLYIAVMALSTSIPSPCRNTFDSVSAVYLSTQLLVLKYLFQTPIASIVNTIVYPTRRRFLPRCVSFI